MPLFGAAPFVNRLSHLYCSSSNALFCFLSTSLYPGCHWDDKAIRRLIGDGRLAARLKGNDARQSVSDQECPICFLHYAQVNVTQCCKARICTECFLQVRPQREKHSVCPFCNHPKMYVAIAKRLGAGEIQERETKEQSMIEASIRARAQGEEVPQIEGAVANNGFGSSLEQNETVRRARSRTMSSDCAGDTSRISGGAANMNGGGVNEDVQLLRQLSLSSHDRQSLEQEMRAQHTHPLALQMEAEAEERRINNELEYYRNNPQRSRDAALTRARMLSTQSGGSNNGSLRNRFSRINSAGGRSGRRGFGDYPGDGNSLDDMVVLEAALLLSMEEEDARNQGNSNEGSGGGNSGQLPPSQQATGMPGMLQLLGSDSNGSRRRLRGRTASASSMTESGPSFSRGLLSEDEQVAMAIAISMQEQQDSSSESNKGDEEEESCDSKPKAHGNGGGKTPPESAPPKATPAAAAVGVASLPIVSEDDGDGEEEIIFSQSPEQTKGKTSLDDTAYFRMLETGGGKAGNDKAIPSGGMPELQEETMEMPLATAATTSGSEATH